MDLLTLIVQTYMKLSRILHRGLVYLCIKVVNSFDAKYGGAVHCSCMVMTGKFRANSCRVVQFLTMDNKKLYRKKY
jgi:hypothetical protein